MLMLRLENGCINPLPTKVNGQNGIRFRKCIGFADFQVDFSESAHCCMELKLQE